MKLKIEGKLRDGFFEWLKLTHYEVDYNVSGEIDGSVCWVGDIFDVLPQSAQFGLLQEYADTLGYDVIANPYNMFIHGPDDFKMIYKYCESRTKAQVAAIKKWNEIINK